MSLSIYIYTYQKINPVPFSYTEPAYLGGKLIYLYLIFRTPHNSEITRAAFNKKRNGKYLLKNCKIDMSCNNDDFLRFKKAYERLLDVDDEWANQMISETGGNLINLIIEIN